MELELERYKKFLLKRIRKSLLIGGSFWIFFMVSFCNMLIGNVGLPTSIIVLWACFVFFFAIIPGSNRIFQYIYVILCYKYGEYYNITQYEHSCHLYVFNALPVNTKNKRSIAQLMMLCELGPHPYVFVMRNLNYYVQWKGRHNTVLFKQATLFHNERLYEYSVNRDTCSESAEYFCDDYTDYW